MAFILPLAAAAATAIGGAATGAGLATTALSALTAGAAGLSAYGSLEAGATQKAISNYDAQVQTQKAQEASDQSQEQAAIDEANNRRALGRAAASYGAAGLDMTGTPLSVMSDLASQGELTRQLDLYKGKITAQSDLQQGALDQAQGLQAQTAGYFNAGTSLLTGALNTLGPKGLNVPGLPRTGG